MTRMTVLADMDGACRWLMERTDVERISPSRLVHDTLKLDRMHKLLELLGNPHRAFRGVHVAGTKGKGSTCEMSAAMLESCGYAVGLYTSPHLMSIRERIRLNREPVSEQQFVELSRRVADAEARLDESEGEPTFFELMTAMAFCHFEEQAVDVAVVEVGLGGRLDSTNVITPEVCAITNISLDHTQILGDTVEKIAREKAGIFKPGVPVVASQQTPAVLEVLWSEAQRVGAPIEVVGKEIEFTWRFEQGGAPGMGGPGNGRDAAGGGAGGWGGSRVRVSVTGTRMTYEHLTVPLKGEHQAANCALALAVLDKLAERGFKVPEDRAARGLASVRLPGRMELVGSSPRVLLDGAHNAESVRQLMRGASAHLSYESMVVVFGCAADKDIPGMLRELGTGADKVVFTKSHNTRAADPRELARRFNDLCGKMCQTAPDIRTAMDLARRAVKREDLICVTGSLYLVAETRALMGIK